MKKEGKKKRWSNWLSHLKDSYLILKKKKKANRKEIENFSPVLINIYNTKKKRISKEIYITYIRQSQIVEKETLEYLIMLIGFHANIMLLIQFHVG